MAEELNSEQPPLESAVAEERRDANICIAAGAGVGALGTFSALAAGATCPLCVIIAPGLIGLGAYKHWRAGKK